MNTDLKQDTETLSQKSRVQNWGWQIKLKETKRGSSKRCQNGASHMCDTMSFLREQGRVCPDPLAMTRKP